MSKFDEFEKAVLTLVRRVLAEESDRLQALRLTPQLQELVQRGQGRPDYSSEVTIYFWDSIALGEGRRDLADVLEFHAVERGKSAASMEEIEVWIRSALQDVCDRRGADQK